MRKLSVTPVILLFVISMLIAGSAAKAQQTTDLYKPDPRLYEVLDKAYVDKLQADRSELVIYYNYYLDNCYYTAPLNGEKPVEGTDITTVSLKYPGNGKQTHFTEKKYDRKTFNPMKYNFTFGMGVFTTYIWKSAGIAVICRSSEAISSGYKEYLRTIEIKK